MRLRFASFLLDLELGTLEGPDGDLHLRPQAFRLLELLVRESPRILGADELLNSIWGTEHLSENSLRQTISELRQALGDSATRPRIIETVHRRGYRMIACVEILPPEERSAPAENGESNPLASRSATSRGFMVAALLLLALWTLPRPNAEVASVATRPAIAILGLEGFDADSSQMSWLDSAVREILRFELGVAGTARLINGEEVEWACRKLGIEDRSALSPATLRRLGQRLGARWVIHGSYVASDSSSGLQDVQIQLQVREAESGEVIGWARERGSSQEILEVVGRLLRSVRAFLPSTEESSEARHLEAQRWLASSGDSLRLFARGAEALGRREALLARELLEQAVAIDLDNPLHHSTLAAAYQELGLSALATTSAERAAELADTLTWEYRLSVEAHADQMAGRCDQAAERLSTLHQRFPDDVDYGLRLSQSYYCAGQLSTSLEVLRALRARPLFGIADLHLDLREIRVLVALHRLDEAADLTRRAIESALERDAPMLATTGRVELFWIHFRQGQWAEAEVVLEQLESSLAPEYVRRRAVMHSCRAALRHRQGEMSEAREAYEQALALYRRIGNRKGEAAALNNYASLLNNLGEQEGMTRALTRAIELKREIGQPGSLVTSLSNLANVYILRERLADARPVLAEAEALARDIEDPHRLTLCLRSQGRLFKALGQLDTAEAKYREALVLSTEMADGGGIAWAHRGLGSVLRASGLEQEAHDHFRRAVVEFERVGDLPEAVATRGRLADLELSRDRLASAHELFREVLTLTEGGDLLTYQAEARQGLATIARARGELEIARRELGKARDLWQRAGQDAQASEAEATLGALVAASG